jgi:CHAT domain-containing protein
VVLVSEGEGIRVTGVERMGRGSRRTRKPSRYSEGCRGVTMRIFSGGNRHRPERGLPQNPRVPPADATFPILKLLIIAIALAGLTSCATGYSQYNVERGADVQSAEDALRRSDYTKAFDLYQQALARYTSQKNETGELLCLERMGWIKREAGEYGEALQLFRRAEPLAVRLHGDAAEIDADVGDVYLFTGDGARASDAYQKVVETLKDFIFPVSFTSPPSAEQISGMVRRSKAIIHARTNLGTMYYLAGEYDRALTHLTKADELIERILTVSRHAFYGLFMSPDADLYEGMGFTYTIMGAVLGAKGDPTKAWPRFDAGAEAFGKAKKEFGSLVNRALRYRVEFASGLRIDQAKFEEYDRFLEKAEAFGAVEIVWRMNYEIGRALVRADRRPEALRYLERAVGAIELTRSRLREDAMKQVYAGSVQDVYAEIVNLLYDMNRYAEGFDYLEKAKARAFLDALGGRSLSAKRNVDPGLVKKERELREAIETTLNSLRTLPMEERTKAHDSFLRLSKEREGLLEEIKRQSLEYASTTTVATLAVKDAAKLLGRNAALVSFFVGEKRGIAWIVRGESVDAVTLKTNSKELYSLVSDYVEAIASRQEALQTQVGSRLYETLVGPLASRLSGTSRLLIVPSGALNYLSFAGLPAGQGRFLVHDYAITILPNASSLAFLDKEVTADTARILAIGNPRREEPRMSLRFAEREVGSVSGGFSRRTIWLTDAATETAFKEADLTDIGVIHIAAHGRYDETHPLQSALLLARDGKNDGNLEAFEIFGLRVNARLVVLSACQTGTGTVEGGDEVQSLNRAFLYAGAGSVVASLWNVSDASTALLMERFYAHIEREAPDEALRLAQIDLTAQYPSPFHWAAFYLTGGVPRH